MSKKENHRYLISSTARLMANVSPVSLRQVGLWLGLIILFWVIFVSVVPQGGARPTRTSGSLLPIFLFVGLMGVFFWIQRQRLNRWLSNYRKALQQPEPQALIAVVSDLGQKTTMIPDADAIAAHQVAFAYALYGHGEAARRNLAQINWETRAPVIQAIGLNAEGLAALLGRRDVPQALALFQKAQGLTAVSPLVPGAATTKRGHAVCVAVAEALLGLESADEQTLAKAAADPRTPMQLLASLGLANLRERRGDPTGAEVLRRFLAETAPHCAPLHLKADAFIPGTAPVEGPVPPTQLPTAVPTRPALFKTMGLWIILLTLLMITWALFARPQ